MIDPKARRQVFENHLGQDIWIEGESQFSDSKILLTVSNVTGEETVLITPTSITKSNPKLFVQAPPERAVTPTKARQRTAKLWISYLGYTLSAILISFSVLSAAGFVKARIVLTGSMLPTIKPGDIVILANTPRVTPEVGDVVAYTAKRFNGQNVGTFTHRIIGGNLKDGFLVKGDNNPSPDVQKPALQDISGVVIYVIPMIGRFLTPKMLMILVPFMLGLWLVLDALKNES